MTTSEVHRIGWCGQNNKVLQPPEAIRTKYSDWSQYLVHSLSGASTVPAYLLNGVGFPYCKVFSVIYLNFTTVFVLSKASDFKEMTTYIKNKQHIVDKINITKNICVMFCYRMVEQLQLIR